MDARAVSAGRAGPSQAGPSQAGPRALRPCRRVGGRGGEWAAGGSGPGWGRSRSGPLGCRFAAAQLFRAHWASPGALLPAEVLGRGYNRAAGGESLPGSPPALRLPGEVAVAWREGAGQVRAGRSPHGGVRAAPVSRRARVCLCRGGPCAFGDGAGGFRSCG